MSAESPQVVDSDSVTDGLPLPLKVLCFVPHLGSGGAEMHLLRLLNHFDRSVVAPVLAVVRSGGSYQARLRSDIPVKECGWRKLPSSTLRMQSAIPRLRRFILEQQPAVILTFLDHAVVACVKALDFPAGRHIPLVAGLQNNLAQTLAHLPSWSRRWLGHHILEAYRRTDHVVALSAGAAKTLAEMLPATEQRTSVVYNAGYDREVETMATAEPALPLPVKPILLACGRLTEQKDFPTLLRAFARIKGQTNAELWILGEGELRRDLERQVAAAQLSGRVVMPGFVKNPFAFMARAATFVLSSRWEGFGNVVSEALACGTPVISTDCPHGPREILAGGKWGELVPVGDVDALAGAMLASLNESARFRTRAQAARLHVQAFEAARITRQYEQVLRTVVATHRSRS